MSSPSATIERPRSRRRAERLLLGVLLLPACQTASPERPDEIFQEPGLLEVDAPVAEDRAVDAWAVPPPREADAMLDTGIVLQPLDHYDWGVNLILPVTIGWNNFDLSEISLDQVSTLAVIPTAELRIPLDEHWTLAPFVGLGGAIQLGDGEFVGGSDLIGLATGGVRATRWQRWGRRSWVGFTGDLNYSTALTNKSNVVGDWGRLDLAAEVRRDFGVPGPEPRFQGGLYAQAFLYWNPVELEIEGISPTVIDDHVEVGVSLGTTSKWKIWIFKVPRIFIGAFYGEDVQGARIRFGRL